MKRETLILMCLLMAEYEETNFLNIQLGIVDRVTNYYKSRAWDYCYHCTERQVNRQYRIEVRENDEM